MDGLDHDILIEVKTELKQVRLDIADVKKDIKDVKDNVAHRVENLEIEKIDKVTIDKLLADAEDTHKKLNQRISNLENWRWYLIGIGTIAVLVIDYVIRKL